MSDVELWDNGGLAIRRLGEARFVGLRIRDLHVFRGPDRQQIKTKYDCLEASYLKERAGLDAPWGSTPGSLVQRRRLAESCRLARAYLTRRL